MPKRGQRKRRFTPVKASKRQKFIKEEPVRALPTDDSDDVDHIEDNQLSDVQGIEIVEHEREKVNDNENEVIHTSMVENHQVIIGAEEEVKSEMRQKIKQSYRRSDQLTQRYAVQNLEDVDELDDLDDQLDDIADGDTLTSMAHLSMGRRQRLKKTPKPRPFAHRLQWRQKDMEEALNLVRADKITIRAASRRFNVPYSSLKDRVNGRVVHGARPGVKTVLSPEEELELVNYLRDMAHSGFLVRCQDIRERAGEILRLNYGHKSPYRDTIPGHNWLGGFTRRHPGIEFHRTNQKNPIPSINKQKGLLRRFFEISNYTLKRQRLTTKPDRIFIVNDIRVNVYLNFTMVLTCSAEGIMQPPFVIFKGERLKLSSAKETYPDATFVCSYDGRVNDDMMLWWFDSFIKRIPPIRPIALFLSQSVSAISMQLMARAKEERIYVVSMPPGVSHLLQPIDQTISQNLESTLTEKARKWETQNPNENFNQRALATILQKVWKKQSWTQEMVRKFSNNGLFPLNDLAITPERMHSATLMIANRPPSPQQMIGTQIRTYPAPNRSIVQTDDSLAGLNLLSTLSTHEYATMPSQLSEEIRTQDNDDDDNENEFSARTNPQFTYRKSVVDISTSRNVPSMNNTDGVAEEVEVATVESERQAKILAAVKSIAVIGGTGNNIKLENKNQRIIRVNPKIHMRSGELFNNFSSSDNSFKKNIKITTLGTSKQTSSSYNTHVGSTVPKVEQRIDATSGKKSYVIKLPNKQNENETSTIRIIGNDGKTVRLLKISKQEKDNGKEHIKTIATDEAIDISSVGEGVILSSPQLTEVPQTPNSVLYTSGNLTVTATELIDPIPSSQLGEIISQENSKNSSETIQTNELAEQQNCIYDTITESTETQESYQPGTILQSADGSYYNVTDDGSLVQCIQTENGNFVVSSEPIM